MKENFFGPRQWAFVVITGGAACALPFVQTDKASTPADKALTQTDSLLTPIDTSLTSSQHGSSLEGGGIVPALPSPRLPEWANADRSPFDELVGVTAAKPKAAAATEPLPMQPLRPWIAGPTDAASLASTAATPRSLPSTSASESAVARREPSAGGASPWSAEPPAAGFTPIEQLAATPSRSPATSAMASEVQWPDQAVSAEQVAQATRTRERDRPRVVVAPPPLSTNPSSPLLAAPVLPAPGPRPLLQPPSQLASQRASSEPYLPPAPATAQTSLNNSNLPPLPETRKSHIIFQPGNWK